MNQNDITQKNILLADKLLNTIKEISIIDNNLHKKFRNNVRNVSLYNQLLETSNNNLFTIIKNLK